jgi:hypothetical protein
MSGCAADSLSVRGVLAQSAALIVKPTVIATGTRAAWVRKVRDAPDPAVRWNARSPRGKHQGAPCPRGSAPWWHGMGWDRRNCERSHLPSYL